VSVEALLTGDAGGELEEIYDYIAEHDTPSKADYVLDQIQTGVDAVAAFPERGARPHS